MADENPRVRRRACEVAAVLQNACCADAAMARLDDDDRLVRGSAADFLRRIRHAPALAIVAQRMLASPQDFLTGAITLRNWGDKPGTESLRAHLASHEASIRAAACLAIVQYGGKALAPTLVEIAASDLPRVAGAALHALDALNVQQTAEAEARAYRRPDSAEVQRERGGLRRYSRI
jgi:HEAT repeat protein